MANTQLQKKINDATWDSGFGNTLLSLGMLVILVCLALSASGALVFWAWFVVGFQSLGLLLRLAGWRAVSLSPADRRYLSANPYKG